MPNFRDQALQSVLAMILFFGIYHARFLSPESLPRLGFSSEETKVLPIIQKPSSLEVRRVFISRVRVIFINSTSHMNLVFSSIPSYIYLRKPPLNLLPPSISPNFRGLIHKHDIDPRHQIHLLTVNRPRFTPMYHSMHPINNQEDRNPNIRRQEWACREPTREEYVEPIDQCKKNERNQSNPSSEWSKEGMIRDLVFRKGLSDIGFSESDIDNAAAYPGDETRCISEIYEPAEDDASAICAVEVGEDAEEG